MRALPTRLLSFSALLTLTACGSERAGTDAPTDEPPFTTRDSAGVEIVEIARAEWPDGRAWRVAPTPELDVGTLDGDPDQQFYRVVALDRLSDGRIVVANAGTAEVRAYSPEGALLWSAGGEGDGPGEFASLVGAAVRHDTVFAYDRRTRRVTLLDDTGALLGTVPLETSESLPIEVWPTDDGFIGLHLLFSGELSEGLTADRRTVSYRRYEPDGGAGPVLAERPGLEVMHVAWTEDGLTAMTMTTPIAAHRHRQALVEGRLLVGITDRWVLDLVDPAGRVVRSVRVPFLDAPLTEAEWDRLVNERLAEAEDEEARRFALDVADGRPKPEARPAFGRFVADTEGFVWIAPWRPDPEGPTPWRVLDPRGRLLGEVELANGFVPRHIGPDHVLGTWDDEFDVTHLRMYRLTR